MPDVYNGNVKIHYELYGSGPPLVVLSGWSETPESLGQDSLLPLLAQHFTLIAIDNRGAGQSGRPAPWSWMNDSLNPIKWVFQWTLDQMANDVEAVLNNIGVDRVHLLGNSLGGMVAGEFAHREQSRDKVASMVLLESGPGITEVPVNFWTVVTLAKFLGQHIPWVKNWSFMRVTAPTTIVNPPPPLAMNDSPGANVGALQQLATIPSYFGAWELRNVTAPTLVVHGTHDGVIPFINTHILHWAIRDSRVVKVPGATHSVVNDNAQAVVDNVVPFLVHEQGVAKLPDLNRGVAAA